MQKYYQKLTHLPGFVLLESTDRTRARFDIVSAYPYDAIKIEQHEQKIEDILERLRQKLVICSSDIDLPFQGGAIGYIAYDLGAKLLGIHAHPQPTLNDMPLLDLGFYDWAIITDHVLKKVTLFSANTQHLTPNVVKEVLALWNGPESHGQEAILKTEFSPLITQEEYEDAFRSIYQSLIKGRSYQVNYTQPFHAHYEGDSWQFYKQVSKKNPVTFSAFLRTSSADILSFSPERFFTF